LTIVVLAGPNGSGKSTTAPVLLRDRLGIANYVNADTLAAGLAAFDPASAAFDAGRLMLVRLARLRRQRVDFAFETTLATRGYAAWLRDCRSEGYQVVVVFLSLPYAETALQRVAARVVRGGHDIPETTVRRRFERGLANFFNLYVDVADQWYFLDNSGTNPELLASGGIGEPTVELSKRYVEFEQFFAHRIS
jgi:predicted ABC-type ATPase